MILRTLRNFAPSALFCNQWRSFSSLTRVIDVAGKDGELRVFMVAGEVSGDSIASRLMASLKQISPLPVRFAGVGGDLMFNEGLQSLFPMEDISVMGIWELLPHLNKMRINIKRTAEAAVSFQPHVVVTVDSKGFSFRFLRLLRARCNQLGLGGPVHVHYVAPSFWAWKGGEVRLKGLRGFVDHLLCILPLEEEVCCSNGLAATFVGHPILEDVLNMNLERDPGPNKWKIQGNSESFRSKHGITSDFELQQYGGGGEICGNRIMELPSYVAAEYEIKGATVITLLPGSRLQEVTRMLPIFLNAMEILNHSFPKLATVIPVAPNRDVRNYIETAIQKQSYQTLLISGVSQNLKYDAFSASQAALSTSGTAILELQLARLPCVVAYRAHLLTEWIIRYKTKLRHISLPNILLDSAVIPEALFGACTPKNLASFLSQVITDESFRDRQVEAAERVFEMLSPSKKNTCSQACEEIGSSGCSPSLIAANTILYSAKRL